MGKNKFENFIFSLMVCFSMVLCMTIYNTLLHANADVSILGTLFSFKFISILVIAFILDWFLVAPFVKYMVAQMTNESTPFIKKIILISGLMVLSMCTLMSMIALMFQGYEGSLLAAYGKMFGLNIIFALPLQFVLVGPVVRGIFLKMFPPAPLVVG